MAKGSRRQGDAMTQRMMARRPSFSTQTFYIKEKAEAEHWESLPGVSVWLKMVVELPVV
jgi:hypothetical protein